MKLRAVSLLGVASCVITFGQVASANAAEECSYAFRNYNLYKQSCQASDGCGALQRSEQLARNACGGTLPGNAVPGGLVPQVPAITMPTPIPSAPVSLRPDKKDQDCQYLRQRLNDAVRANTDDPNTLATKRRLVQATCGSDNDDACAALIRYREQALPNEWRKALRQLTAYEETKADLQKLRDDLNNDLFWIGNWRENTALFLNATKAAGNLLTNSLGIDPVTGRYVRMLKASTNNASSLALRYLDAAQKGIDIYDAVSKEEWLKLILKVGFDVAEEQTRAPAAAAAKTLYDLATDIYELVSMPENFKTTRAVMNEALDRLDRELDRTNAKLTAAMSSQDAIQAMFMAITQACPPEKRLP
jgi:hypothetical protein